MLKIEKLHEVQGCVQWVNVWNGPFVVTGTNDPEEAKEFIRHFLQCGPALGNPDDMGATSIPDWTK